MPMPMDNDYTEHFDGIRQVNSFAVDQMCKFQQHLFGDISSALKLSISDDLRHDVLKKANKDQLCSWLETLSFVFNKHSVPYLKKFSQATERIEELQEAQIKNQGTIIELQNQLLVAKDEQVKTLQATVQSEVKLVQNEVKTFSSVLQQEIKTQSTEVQKNVARALSVKKVGDAVKQVAEKEERCRNVVIYGVAEEENQPLETRVGAIFQHVGQKPRIVECCRLGRVQDDATRPVKVTLSSSAIVTELLRNSKMLKNADGCQKIFVCPDRTVEQRKAQKGLLEQLRQMRTENPSAKYRIKNGKVIPCENSVA